MALFTNLLRKLHLIHTPKLGYLGQMAKEHWQEYCPNMYRELEESGQLGVVSLNALGGSV